MDDDRIKKLTARQRECLALVREGYSGKEIAAALQISPNVVKEHLAAARTNLGVSSSMSAARILAAALDTPPGERGLSLVGDEQSAIEGWMAHRSGQRQGAGFEMRETVSARPSLPALLPATMGPVRFFVHPDGRLSWLGKIVLALVIAIACPLVLGAVLTLQSAID